MNGRKYYGIACESTLEGHHPRPWAEQEVSWSKERMVVEARGRQGCKRWAPALPAAWNAIPCFLLAPFPGIQVFAECLLDQPFKAAFPGTLSLTLLSSEHSSLPDTQAFSLPVSYFECWLHQGRDCTCFVGKQTSLE